MGAKTTVMTLWRTPAGPILLAAQVALTLMIVANVAYISFVRLETTGRPTGIDIGNIFWMSVQAFGKNYDPVAGTRADLAYLNGLPDVISASATNAVPQTFLGIRSQVSATPELKGAQRLAAVYQITDNFIDTLGLKLIRGRAPRGSLLPPEPVAGGDSKVTFGGEVIITLALADRLYGGSGQALGKPVYFGLLEGRAATVVGVVELMQAAPYFAADSSFVNELVLTPTYQTAADELYLVRTKAGARNEVMSKVQREFESVQNGRYLDRIQSLAKTAAMMRGSDRISAITLLVLSSLVVTVTMLGLFGFAAFSVTGRLKEIGTRRAIGATRSDIARQFVLENLLIATPGIVLGCIVTLAFSLQLSLLMELPRLPSNFSSAP